MPVGRAFDTPVILSTKKSFTRQHGSSSACPAHRIRMLHNKAQLRGTRSIFDPDESAWDHVFKDLSTASKDLIAGNGQERMSKRTQAQQMTAREIDTFGEMFDMLFQGGEDGNGISASSSLDLLAPGVGRKRPQEMSDLARHLRNRSRNVRWTSEADQELDRKKEEMDLCNTDQQLLEWAMREVFTESQRYEEQARAMAPGAQPSPQLQPLSYPHLIAMLMRTFRDKYADPHLALAVFDYSRHLSTASYVFGCTTHAYNELIETRWRCFRDLRGVCEALEEMRVNGIEMDTKTRGLAELVRREVGERNLWEEETSIGGGEVWEMIARIEHLTAVKLTHRDSKMHKTWSKSAESWKQHESAGLADNWEFGNWNDNVPTSLPIT
ncbi:hypothetical protein BDW22DRAFT_1355335 [Trametopsis cervina]|nr:hypothetical protein BDW22DRAFT_1355335 [Trametopsis cervina]